MLLIFSPFSTEKKKSLSQQCTVIIFHLVNQLLGKGSTHHRTEACAPNRTGKAVVSDTNSVDCGWRLRQRLPLSTLNPRIQVPVPQSLVPENYHTETFIARLTLTHALAQLDGDGRLCWFSYTLISPTLNQSRKGNPHSWKLVSGLGISWYSMWVESHSIYAPECFTVSEVTTGQPIPLFLYVIRICQYGESLSALFSCT